MYSLDFDKLIKNNLPYLLRKPVLKALIGVCNTSISNAYDSFIAFKAIKDVRLSHNGQVYLLEKILNDLFDNTLRRIDISDLIVIEEIMIGCKENLATKYVRSARIGATVPQVSVQSDLFVGCKPNYYPEHDFVVSVPTVLESQEVEISKIIGEYKMAGKTYRIEYI